MKKIADQFAHVLCKELNRPKKKMLNWQCAGPKGWGVGHQSVDVTGYELDSETPVVFVKIERRRDAPVSNVVKVRFWINEQKKKGRLKRRPILIQAFSARYPKENTQRKLAEFIGNALEMRHAGKYISLPFSYNPQKRAKNCEGACKGHAKRLAHRIIRLCVSYL